MVYLCESKDQIYWWGEHTFFSRVIQLIQFHWVNAIKCCCSKLNVWYGMLFLSQWTVGVCQILLVGMSPYARTLSLRLWLSTAAMIITHWWDRPSFDVSCLGIGHTALLYAKTVCLWTEICIMDSNMWKSWFLHITVDCGGLPAPTGGQITFGQGTGFEAAATYSCSEGYTLIGQTQQICLSSGEWSGNAPSCKKGDIHL